MVKSEPYKKKIQAKESVLTRLSPLALISSVLEDFEELDRAYQKSKKVIEAEGFPRFVVRCLVDLEDFIGEIWEDKEARKKMSKLNSKGEN